MLILQIIAVVLAAVMLARALHLILLMRWYSKPQSPGDVLFVNDKRVYYRVKGQESPTVVIEAGLGSGSAEWWAIQDELSSSARVVTYDRAGYGWSELSLGPRTSRQIAQELKNLLEALKIDPPFVLVGHSQGGLYVHHFCRLYPDLVCGVVLIDPMSPEDARFRQELLPRVYKRSGVDKLGALKMQGWISGFGFARLMKPYLMKSPGFSPYRSLQPLPFRAFWNNFLAPKTAQTALNEYLQTRDPRNMIDLKNSGTFPDVPLRIVVHDADKMRDELVRLGDLSKAEADTVEGLWQNLMRAHSSLSAKGSVVSSEAAGHFIHLTQPQIVVRTILEVAKEAAKR